MMEKFPTIIIPEKNDFIYCLTIPDSIDLASVEDLHVYISTTPKQTIEAGFTINGSQIKIPFRNLQRGYYNLWCTFKKDGQRVSYNYDNAFHIVAWNNQYINWLDYKEGSEIAVEAGVCLLVTFSEKDFEYLWNTMDRINSLNEECEGAAQEAHDAAEYAKQEGDAAKQIYEQVKESYESGEFKGEKGDKGDDGYTPVKGVDYFDGKNGADGTILYPAMRVDPSGYLVADVPECSQDSNLGIDNEGFLYFEMPTE